MFMLIFHLKPPIDLKSLLIREAANQRTTMEKWIGYEEEGFFIPRVRETPDKVEGLKLKHYNPKENTI